MTKSKVVKTDANAAEIIALKARVAELETKISAQGKQCASQLKLAAKVHKTLLPKPVRHKRIDIDVRYLPIEAVGGDYCQIRFVREDACYITMCDVTGHGIAPALMASRISSEVRHLIRDLNPPHKIVESVNTMLANCFKDTHFYPSFAAAYLDLSAKNVTWSGAGHPGPILIHTESDSFTELFSQNTLIGVQENCLAEEPEHTLDLKSGDRLLFYTDGLTETVTTEGNYPGVVGLAEIALTLKSIDLFQMADRIIERINACHGEFIPDDKTLIIAEIK